MTAFHTLGASLHPQEGIEKYCTCLSFYHWFVAVTIMHIHANNIIYQCCFYNFKLLDKVEIGTHAREGTLNLPYPHTTPCLSSGKKKKKLAVIPSFRLLDVNVRCHVFFLSIIWRKNIYQSFIKKYYLYIPTWNIYNSKFFFPNVVSQVSNYFTFYIYQNPLWAHFCGF